MIDYEEASQLLYGIGDGSLDKKELTVEQTKILFKVFKDLMPWAIDKHSINENRYD